MKKNKNLELINDLSIFKDILKGMNKLNKKRLNRIMSYMDGKSDKVHVSDDKKDLIGIIPTLLTNHKIIPTNLELFKIANELGIYIPHWNKKSYEDIIGRIVVSISRFDEKKLKRVNRLFKSLTPQIDKADKDTFFSEWEKAIKKVVRKDD